MVTSGFKLLQIKIERASFNDKAALDFNTMVFQEIENEIPDSFWIRLATKKKINSLFYTSGSILLGSKEFCDYFLPKVSDIIKTKVKLEILGKGFVNDEYFILQITKKIDCIDYEKSVFKPHPFLSSPDIEKCVFDTSKINKESVFFLIDGITNYDVICVRDDLADFLKLKNFGINFFDLNEWESFKPFYY